eukprot:998317-Pelagomonas_calceolata.AAC.2
MQAGGHGIYNKLDNILGSNTWHPVPAAALEAVRDGGGVAVCSKQAKLHWSKQSEADLTFQITTAHYSHQIGAHNLNTGWEKRVQAAHEGDFDLEAGIGVPALDLTHVLGRDKEGDYNIANSEAKLKMAGILLCTRVVGAGHN